MSWASTGPVSTCVAYSSLLFPVALRSSWYCVDFTDRELEAYKIKLT